MAELNVNGRRIQGTVERFALSKTDAKAPWSADAARQYVDASYLPDNLFLTDGKDCYVVSKQGMNLGRETVGKHVTLDGKPMTVFRANDNPDTWFQKAVLSAKLFGLQVKFWITGGGVLDRTFG